MLAEEPADTVWSGLACEEADAFAGPGFGQVVVELAVRVGAMRGPPVLMIDMVSSHAPDMANRGPDTVSWVQPTPRVGFVFAIEPQPGCNKSKMILFLTKTLSQPVPSVIISTE